MQQGHWQSVPAQHAEVVTKQERDPELNDSDHIPSGNIKIPQSKKKLINRQRGDR